jgi:protein-disulfide isomerase
MRKKSKSYTPILFGLLLVGAFFLGSLTTKVSYLEKGTTSGSSGTASAPNAAAPQNPQAPQPQNANAAEVTDRDHIRGNENAEITLIEYSDLECPFCQRFHTTMQEIMTEYGDKVRWVYRHYPLAFHANAQKEAEGSECVAELGGNDAFWEFIDKMFERTTANGTGFALDALGPLAAEVGVNQSQFQRCLDDGKYEQYVKDQLAEGTTAGVSGTPSTFIVNSNGESQIVVGAQPIDAFKAIIDQQLGS